MIFTQKYPKLDVHGFLECGIYWLNSEIDIGLFYAALDLRFSFERLLVRHGFASKNPSKAFDKLNWQPRKLYYALREEFINKLDINKSYVFFINNDDNIQLFGYFLAIPDNLFINYQKLDKLLHSQWGIPIGDPKKEWYLKTKKQLSELAYELIPHSNPDNSLDWINLSKIHYEEVESKKVEMELELFWKTGKRIIGKIVPK